jgi:RimJ/RimL family protein N-acetyltransferase
VLRLFPPGPPLRDGDLVLRRTRSGDASAIREIYSEQDTRRWMGWDGPLPDEEDALATIQRAADAWTAGTWAVFGIVDAGAAVDQVLGGANLRFADHDTAEVSYFLRASARGRGFATRAVFLLARWAFDELGIQRLELRAHPDNEASIRVAERAGFTREGIERASRSWPDGSRFDSVLFSLLPTDARPV